MMPSEMVQRLLKQWHKHGMAKLHGMPPTRREAAAALSLLYAPSVDIYTGHTWDA